MKKLRTFYERNLPHIMPLGATFFVTFRLYGSIPYAILEKMKKKYEDIKAKIITSNEPLKNKLLYEARRKYFLEFDGLLDKIKSGPMWLKNPEVAEIVEKEIKRFDGEFYKLVCYEIMSNHVHLIIDTSIQVPAYYSGLDKDDSIYTQLVLSELNFHHLSRTLLHIDFFIRWSNSNGYSPASFPRHFMYGAGSSMHKIATTKVVKT